ncbi:hypothetical protein HMI51_11855 [Corallococcus coralloides]|nr:hypothetical protein [Corallococcus coralloides]
MTLPFPSSMPRFVRACVLSALTFTLVPACGEDTSPNPTTLSATERQELNQRISELEAEVTRLEGQLSEQQQQQGATEQEKQALSAEVGTLKQQLAEARELLASQDWDGVLVKLEAARGELERLKGVLAATDGALSLNAGLVFGGAPFALDQTFTTAGGDSLKFTELRYWLSNVKLRKQDGTKVALVNSYHLMEVIKAQSVEGTSSPVALPANRREQVDLVAVPAGVYTGIEFSVGVDPTYNDDLSRQAGELHVLKNMTSSTWMWFTSYIFTKTKGQYVKADGTSDTFAWETGTNADYRTVNLDFTAPVTVNSQKQVKVNLRADVAALFTSLSPRTTNTINANSATERATLSDGFKSMFSLASVENPDR